MAVQQNKKSPSKRGMHRAHDALAAPGLAVEPTTGEVHLRHRISPTGFYRGRKVLKTKADAWAGGRRRRAGPPGPADPPGRRRPDRRLGPMPGAQPACRASRMKPP